MSFDSCLEKGRWARFLKFLLFISYAVSQIGAFRLLDQQHAAQAAVRLSQRRSSVKPGNAEPKRNDSIVPLAATTVAPGRSLFIGDCDVNWKKVVEVSCY